MFRKLLKILFATTLIVLSFSCASMTKQSDALYETLPPLRSPVQNQAPFIKQEIGHCGPATLTMALQSLGFNSTLEEITKQTYTPEKGTLQTDMITSARRQGAMALQIHNINDLLAELEAGHNVIVFLNLGLSWLPKLHYGLVTGYDLDKKTLTMHSGPDADLVVNMKNFERDWNPADYWALLVLPPTRLSVTASDLNHAEAAAGLEQIDQLEAAKSAYQTILANWPKNLISMIGLGNIFYKQQNFKMSVQYLKTAVKEHPNSLVAKNNLQTATTALAEQKKKFKGPIKKI